MRYKKWPPLTPRSVPEESGACVSYIACLINPCGIDVCPFIYDDEPYSCDDCELNEKWEEAEQCTK